MRVVVLANNRLGLECVRVVVEAGADIVAIVVHPDGQAVLRDEIVRASGVPADAVFEATRLGDPSTVAAIAALGPELGVSAFFGFILRREFLDLFSEGVINLHPSLLPWNRGAYANVWAIVDQTPAGVTLHYIDEGVDTGDIIAQRQTPLTPVDTGATLYDKLISDGLDLFRETFPRLLDSGVTRSPQPENGSSHKVADVALIDEIHLDRQYHARELIDIIRARTFAPHAGAYFMDGDRKVYLRLQLIPEGEFDG